MSRIRSAVARHPVPAYVILAVTLTWPLLGLVSVSVAFGLLALFGPAAAAVIVSWADGTTGELRSRITDWRQPVSTYLLALGIPFAVAAVGALVYIATGGTWAGLGGISPIEAVIFVLVIGEEIGWRGFLQPRLRARMGIVQSGVVTGLIWIGWHAPMYLSPDSGLGAFLAFAWWVLPLAVVMGFVTERARYSVIVATLMHGGANIASPILLPGVDFQWVEIVTGAVYLALAIGLSIPALRATAARRADRTRGQAAPEVSRVSA
jgi:uncharacterized protein